MRTRLLLICGLSLAAVPAQGPSVHSWEEAGALEARLESTPSDVATRVDLLRYYTQQGAAQPDRVKPLRRRHILWMVENQPENPVLSEPSGMMMESGTSLADPEGFMLCRAAWDKALSAPQPADGVFANAIAFYKTADPARARRISEDGLKLYPRNALISDKLGMLIAYSIAGVKTVDQNGEATSFDEAIAKGAVARQDRKTLEESKDPNLLSGAFRALAQQRRPLLTHKLTARWKDVLNLTSVLDERISQDRFIGHPAPDFRLQDLNGKEVTLAEFKGKVVLLDFWATWCGPCREELPALQRIHRDLADKDVVVLALDAKEEKDVVAKFIEKQKYTFPVLLTPSEVLDGYRIHAYPSVFAIDKNGLVAEILWGSAFLSNGSRLHKAIETARAGAKQHN